MVDTVEPHVVHLICSSGFYGAERVVANLSHTVHGVDTSVLCLTNSPKGIAEFMQQVLKADKVFRAIPNGILPAMRVLRRLKEDHPQLVIHAHGYKEIVIASLFQRWHGAKVVVTQHGFTTRNRKSHVYNWIDMACCRWGDVEQVLCVSEAIKTQYLRFGVSPSRVVLAPNGVPGPQDLDRESAKQRMATSLGVDASLPMVLYAGRMSAEKDPLLFLASVEKMLASGQRVVAIMAGEGPLMPEVKARIAAKGLGEHVWLLGFVADIEPLLLAADIVLLTSTTEGTPMIVLEAMMRQCAVVGTRVGGMASIIPTPECGLLVDSRDPEVIATQCSLVLTQSGLRQSMGLAAATRAQDYYSLESQVDGYQQRYRACYS